MSAYIETKEGFPYLDLRKVPFGMRIYTAARLLNRASAHIRSRGLHIEPTFSIRSSDSTLMGFSGGPVSFECSGEGMERITPYLLALEDRRFHTHFGIDIRGIARAAIHNLRSRRIVEGGSTITQQLVRNTFLYPHKSALRKLAEAALAVQIERQLSKSAILSAYLSLVYFGPNIRGAEAALRIYHRRTSKIASVREIVSVLGALRKPMRTNPIKDPPAYDSRATKLLSRLSLPADAGRPTNPISDFPQKTRLSELLKLDLPDDIRKSSNPSKRIRSAHTTLEKHLQRSFETAAQDCSLRGDVTGVAAVALNKINGKVVAEVAYANGRSMEYSPAYHGKLQAGSTYKPFVLLEALEQGLSLDHKIVSSPYVRRIDNSKTGTWLVTNHDHVYLGSTTLLDALIASDNTVFCRLCEMLGTDRVTQRLCDLGLAGAADKNSSIALGATGAGISLISLARAYASLSTGCLPPPSRILQSAHFVDGSKHFVPTRAHDSIRATRASLDLLDLALMRTGINVSSKNVRGKSGTSKSGSLYAGYDDNYSYAVWVGFRATRSEWWSKGLRAKGILERVLNRIGGRSASFMC